MDEVNTGNVTVVLQSVTCPSCGSRLKYRPGETSVTCPFCDGVYYVNKQNNNDSSQSSNVHKIEGMQTPSSTLAYVEQYFDNYDWDAFAHDEDLSIYNIDKMLGKTKAVSADDYKTWAAAFLAIVIPLNKKIESRDRIFKEALEEYKKDNADAFSMYESYKRITNYLITNYQDRIDLANKYLEYASKYGIPKEYKAELVKMINYKAVEALKETIFDSINDVPIIVEYNKKQEEELKEELLKEGINADETYNNAVELFKDKKYKSALKGFYSLCGYKDSDKYIEHINRMVFLGKDFFITDDGVFYTEKRTKAFSIYRVENGKQSDKTIAKNVSKIICNYGGTILYFDNESYNNLKALNLLTGEKTKIQGGFLETGYHKILDLGKIYLISTDEYRKDFDLVELDVEDLSVKKLFATDSKEITYFGSHIIYFKKNSNSKISTYAYDIFTGESFLIASNKVSVVGVIGDRYFLTLKNPNLDNKALFYIDRKPDAVAKLIENNITSAVTIFDERIYYYSKSNTGYYYLVSNNLDGTDRVELSSRVRKLLFKQGDWLYCIRGYGYNTVLGRIKTDGTCLQSIASQIEYFVKIENGFIYYIDDEKDFCRVRMDGGKNSVLAHGVSNVLKIDDNSVIYSARDGDNDSLYEIEFGKKGHRKLAYLTLDSKKYDDDTIYFINKKYAVNKDGVSEGTANNFLKQINIQTYEEKTLFKYDPEERNGCYIATCVYGSYDCPQVWMLRRYRDYYLDERWWGRAFIKVYYAISPKLVKIFGKNPLFLKFNRYLLNRKIRKLQKLGYQDTRYNDKY